MSLEWREFNVRTPIVASASEEALDDLFPERDGRWSGLIGSAMKAFGAKALDLNQAWADTPQAWFCPCCGRSKAHLIRLSKADVLLAHLHEHHDHLHELIAHRLQKVFGDHWVAGISEGTYHLEHLGSQLIERFERVLVCADCNMAEADAKRSIRDIDPYFSFRPSEIRQFSTIEPNQPHRIDPGAATAIWTEAEPEFRERVALAGRLADLVVEGRFLRERSRSYGGALGTSYVAPETLDLLRRMTLDPVVMSGLREERDALMLRSIARGAVGTGRAARPPIIAVPTEAELLAHDGGQYPQLWARLDPDWRCPACARDRRSILRRSKKPGRRWSGHVRLLRDYDWGPGADEHDPAEVTGHRDLLICDGCDGLALRLKQSEPGLVSDDFTLTVDQIRRCIDVVANRQHEFCPDRLKIEIAGARDLHAAEAEYDRRLHEAESTRRTFAYFLDKEDGDLQRGWNRTVGYLRRSSLGETAVQAARRIRMQIAHADRLSPNAEGATVLPAVTARKP